MATQVGFTGTQLGLTSAQDSSLFDVLWKLAGDTIPIYLRHGDCVGADEAAHSLGLELEYLPIIHPPENESKRAFVVGWYEMLEPKAYLDRNRDIVDASEVLVACPRELVIHDKCRHGTCWTVRYARKVGKPIIIIWPDGTTEGEET